jgi:hypothetical protein
MFILLAWIKLLQFFVKKKKKINKEDFLIIQSKKQKCFQKILQNEESIKADLTVEDLESYWIEFRLISHRKEFLGIKGLTDFFASMGVTSFLFFSKSRRLHTS